MADSPPTVPAAAFGPCGSEQPSAAPARGASAVAEFERLVAEHRERVTRLAYRLLGWRDEVEDVVQEVFLAVFQNLDRFRGDSRVSTWLTTITVNKCRSFLRRRLLRFKILSAARGEVRPTGGVGAKNLGLDGERFEEIRRALRALPARYREVVVLRYLEDMPIVDIADVLGTSRNAVEVRLNRARARLRVSLGELLEP